MTRQQIVDSLTRDFSEPLRDPLWGNIHLSPAFKALAASPPFARLVGIRQLGPAFLVYPGATHSRYAHSLGVFHGARLLALALADRADLGFVSPEGLFSFLAAALCHDLGHFPFAHSLKELDLLPHEALGAMLMVEEPLRSLITATGADPDLAAAIIDHSIPWLGRRETRLFRAMLSGVLDPDKLDYLSRDALFCGVPYGIQDAEYVLERVGLGPNDRPGVDEKGLMSVESILFSKYLMYRSVYWHPIVRSATSMVKKAVWLGLKAGAIQPQELYNLDDAGFMQSIRGRGFEAFGPAREVFDMRPWQLALDLPFDQRLHAGLLDLERRAELEGQLADEIGMRAGCIVIDIPEPVSFESDLSILQGAALPSMPFSASSTVFSTAVVSSFASSLRRLRVFASVPTEALKGASKELLG